MKQLLREFMLFVAFIIVCILFYQVFVGPKIGGGVVYPTVQPAIYLPDSAAVVAPIVPPAVQPAPRVVVAPTIPPSPVPAEPTPIYITTCQETTVYGVPVEVNYMVVWTLPKNFPILLEKYSDDMSWALLSPMTTGRQEEMWIPTRLLTVCP